ncbi:SNF1-related protein kinase catalytic subunit alpha KIN10-like [Andrographis paniculata]|uniref:SNF1-related protein kinase catalytic subunit alpha KIN10-like n=1 Tax=Andrographis paniculata TaxID=175694 RepID=UPI0021E8A01A|nr:SNF1-related protein kinase catalytic subunit alpha KIN10-like [Andrographis paniculata]
MLIVDPMKRMTIPEIHAHPWFQAHLQRYLAVPPPDTAQLAEKDVKSGFLVILKFMYAVQFQIDEEILQELRSRVQNEGTVTYYLLLDNRFRVSSGYLRLFMINKCSRLPEYGYNRTNPNETIASPVGRAIDYPQFGGSRYPVDRKWALGLQVNRRISFAFHSYKCEKKSHYYYFTKNMIPTMVYAAYRDRNTIVIVSYCPRQLTTIHVSICFGY